MKKFRYRLEPILKIKSHAEKQRQKEHAAALMQVYRQRDALQEMDRERLRTYDIQRGRLLGPISPHRMLASSRYLIKLKRDTINGTEFLRGLEHEAERKRLRLVEASREKKIYEKLKERQQAKFNQEVEQVERKTLDEMAVVGFAFRHRR